MLNHSEEGRHLSLIYIIANCGLGSRLLQEAKRCGISGGSVLFGIHQVRNKILHFLGIDRERKEIILMVTNRRSAAEVLEELDRQFAFEAEHSIGFTVPVSRIVGTRSCRLSYGEEKEEQGKMYQLATIIVDKGKADQVLDAAGGIGYAFGVTVQGRGSGVHEKGKLFELNIEPEKELVMLLAVPEDMEKLIMEIRRELKIDDPGNGIIYVQEVENLYGLK